LLGWPLHWLFLVFTIWWFGKRKGKTEIPRNPTICTRGMGKNAAILFILI
jgi:hypothetical protein